MLKIEGMRAIAPKGYAFDLCKLDREQLSGTSDPDLQSLYSCKQLMVFFSNSLNFTYLKELSSDLRTEGCKKIIIIKTVPANRSEEQPTLLRNNNHTGEYARSRRNGKRTHHQ